MGNNRGMQIGVITDSRYVLTGEYGEEVLIHAFIPDRKIFRVI